MIKTICATGLTLFLLIGLASYDTQADIFQPLWQNESGSRSGNPMWLPSNSKRKPLKQEFSPALQWLPMPLDCELKDGSRSIEDYKSFKSIAEGKSPLPPFGKGGKGGIYILQKKRMDVFYMPPEGKHVEPNLSKDGSKVACTSMTGAYARTWLYDFVTGKAGYVAPETVGSFGRSGRSGGISSWREEIDVTATEDIPIAELSWASDNKHYVFASGNRLYIGFSGIQKPLMILEESNAISMPRWAPDGKKIVYVSSKAGSVIDLFLITNVDDILKSAQQGKEVKASTIQLTGKEEEETRGLEFLASWHHNSNQIAYSARRGAYDKQKKGVVDYDICILKLSDSRPKSPLPPFEKGGIGGILINFVRDQYFPQYSPDGAHLAFYSNLWRYQNRLNDNLKRFAIFAKKLSDTNTKDIFTLQRTAWVKLDDRKGPLWSPDGEFLIYIKHSVAEQFPIYALHLSDRRLRRLTNPEENPNNEFVDISDNGKIIAFCSQVGYEIRLHLGVVNFRRFNER